MDMKKERRKVYWRCFALLLALWLVLAGVFSAYVLQDARNQEKQRFVQEANNLANELRGSTDHYVWMQYGASLMLDHGNLSEPFNDYFSQIVRDARERELIQDPDLWNSIVRTYEATSMVSAAVFTYSGEPYWEAAKPGTVGACNFYMGAGLLGISYTTTIPGDGWGREPGGKDMPFALTDFFDTNVIEEIHRELEAHPEYTVWVEAYSDGKQYYPLTIRVSSGYVFTSPVASFEATRGLPDTPEKLRELGNYNGNLPKAAKARPDGRWVEINQIFANYAQVEFEAMCNGSAQLEDVAADPSRLMAYGVDYPADRSEADYTVDARVVRETPRGLLDRTYTAQVGAGALVAVRDPETNAIITEHPPYWIQLAGRSDVWSVAGNYWLATVLISLGGFLAAAWLLAYTTWRGQRTHLLYERRTRETTAALAHDLKTPLAVIRACVENLSEGIHPEKESYYTGEITRQTAIMDHALLDMLELSRMDRPSAPLKLEETGWRELLEGRLEALSPLLAELEVTVEAEGMVRADLAQLERLTDNLLRNALEHSDGVVRVQADSRGLRVYNSGAPIPEEDLPRIWEPYFKGDAARKGGSGLGLALVSAIAKAHGWTCEAKNTESGVEVSILYE